MRTDSLAMLSNGWNHLRGRNIPARQPFDSDVQTEMISQITLFCGEPVASAHQNLTVSCLMRRTFFESLHQQVVYSSFVRLRDIVMSTNQGQASDGPFNSDSLHLIKDVLCLTA